LKVVCSFERGEVWNVVACRKKAMDELRVEVEHRQKLRRVETRPWRRL
jgi:hypothetical protein